VPSTNSVADREKIARTCPDRLAGVDRIAAAIVSSCPRHEFVDGTGHLCKSGGRVVKNVTGYDLYKLLIGSLGTLAVITRLNFRTFQLPSPAAAASLRLFLARKARWPFVAPSLVLR